MRRLLLCAFACAALRAGDDPKIPHEVRTLIDLARSSAPEIFADTIVRLVESGRISQRDAQVELLSDAFAAAGAATEPIRLIAFPATPADTREIHRGRAGDLGIDALTLQGRVLKTLLTVDPVKARELFSAIRRPVLDPRACEDPFIADASAYFEIAAAIAQSGFSAADKDKEAHVQFLTAIVAGIRSPNELAPFAHSLQDVALNPDEWALLGAAFVEKMNTIGADYRPFILSFDALAGEVRTLQQFAQIDGVSEAFRKYAVRQLTAPRCAPDFDVKLESLALTAAETTPASRQENFKTSDPYFTAGDAKLIGDKLRRLQAMRGSDNFRSELTDFLRDFQAWQPSGSDADVLHQRATVLEALLQLLGPGEDRDRVLNLTSSTLAASSAERSAPAEWMWQMHHFVEAAGPYYGKLLTAFRASGNAALVVYGNLLAANLHQ